MHAGIAPGGEPWCRLSVLKAPECLVSYLVLTSNESDPQNVHLVDITMFYAAEGGGVRTYLTAKAEWLRQRTRIQHTVVAPDIYGNYYDPCFVGVPSLPIPGNSAYRLPMSTRVAARVLQRLQPDLIEVGDPYQFAWAALRVKRDSNIPVVAFYHSDLLQIVEHRLGAAARRAVQKYVSHLYSQFDLVLAPSQVMVHRLREIGIERVRHQPLGVDTSVFAPERRDDGLRARLGLPKDARLLIYAGRFTREKKLPLLIDAVHRLGDPYYLVMVGSGNCLAESPRLVHIPFQRDAQALASVIASCDVLVHPGDQETFGLVVLEAMACGIPVLGVAAGGVGELVEPDAGLLVRPGSVAALTEGIAGIYQCDLAALGAGGRRKVLEKYDWNLIVPQLIAQYGSLFAARERAELEAGLTYAID
ncbi:MAG TPA: glycosyltransferase family 1 protein [Burkholderiaceae bacterium]|nr:glycosyltransferase family 1 protein [Burkholderiaceae bacterium]